MDRHDWKYILNKIEEAQAFLNLRGYFDISLDYTILRLIKVIKAKISEIEDKEKNLNLFEPK